MNREELKEAQRKKTKTCFVCPYAFSLFNGNTRHRFGGAEVDAWKYSTWLSKLQWYDVSFVVFDHGQPSFEKYDGVNVYPHSGYRSREPARLEAFIDTVRPFSFIKGIIMHYGSKSAIIFRKWKDTVKRKYLGADSKALWIDRYFVEPRKTTIYDSINADIYCVFGVHTLAAEVAAYCRREQKKYVLFVVSDQNLSKTYLPDSGEQDAYNSPAFLCHFAITQADLVITQTSEQAHMLGRRFSKQSVTIRNSCDLKTGIHNQPPYHEREIALWVGRSDHIKRPQLLLRLAKVFPRVKFVLVMNRAQQSIYTNVLRNKTPNVTVYEHIPFSQIEDVISKSFVLVNTSLHEGFPNVFLQAGKYGVPVLSLAVDPDCFIESNECGIVAHGDFNRLVEGLETILKDRQNSQQFSRNIQDYVTRNHNIEDTIPQLDEAIRKHLLT